MENNNEAADDQGSGWFQVKKKHRRFSVQSWGGSSTANNSASFVRNPDPVNDKSGSSHRNHKLSRKYVAHDKTDASNAADMLKKEERDVPKSGGGVVQDEFDSSKIPPSVVNKFNIENADDPGTQHRNVTSVVTRSKMGALGNDDPALNHVNSLGAEVRFGNIEGDNFSALRKHENGTDTVSFSSLAASSSYHAPSDSFSNMQQTRSIPTSKDINASAGTRKDLREISEEVQEKMINVVGAKVSQKVVVSDGSDEMSVPTKDVSCIKNRPPNDDLKLPLGNCPVSELKFGDIDNNIVFITRNSKNNWNSSPSETILVVDNNMESRGDMMVKPSFSMKLGSDDNSGEVAQSEITKETINRKNDLSSCQSNVEATALKSEEPVVLPDVNESRICKALDSDGGSMADGSTNVGYLLSPETSRCEISQEVSVVASIEQTEDVVRAHDNSSESRMIDVSRDTDEAVHGKSNFSGDLTVEPSAIESGDPTVGAPANGSGDSLEDKFCGSLSNTPITTSEVGETAESKERFRQRLWCFLFENLNRAVDELYLLCELECDKEQMKEAVLVFEEAASDFNELIFRVEEFENNKNISSQTTCGVPLPLKTDHRRPHALSWEVRRMTTSPHRAEILASSMEAFRKIQEERATLHAQYQASRGFLKHSIMENVTAASSTDLKTVSRKENTSLKLDPGIPSPEKQEFETETSRRVNFVKNSHAPVKSSTSDSDMKSSRLPTKNSSNPPGIEKTKRESSVSEYDKHAMRKEKALNVDKIPKSLDPCKKPSLNLENYKDKRTNPSWRTMNAWKEKRNWEEILSSRTSGSTSMSRKSAERARVLHEKLMSPDKKKKNAMDLKKEAEEKHTRAMRIRSELENEKAQKLQRTSEKLNRVSEWQAVRSMKLKEGMHARHQKSESRHEAFLAQVAKRAGDESSKVNEVRFITSLNEENKKLMLRQKLQDSELRRAEKLQVIKIKQKEDMAREEAVLERKKLIEAEKMQRLAEIQRRKEEAQVRREEERKASSAAREARTIEQLRRKEERAKAQQEEAELLAQKLAEKLRESEQRRKFFLEQIRERASMDFRDQSSPFLRRYINKDGQGRSTPINSGDDDQSTSLSCLNNSSLATANGTLQPSVKRRVKKIRQRLMAMKYEFSEPPVGFENAGIVFRTAMGAARAKIGRWLQELRKLRQARKEGAASIGLIIAEMMKFLEGKEAELQASRQAGLLDFIASALPASHTSKPEACQVTKYLLKLLRVVLSAPTNRSYFLAQNLLSPIIPMLSAALENYIKIAASLNVSGTTKTQSSKTSAENLESVTEVLDGFLFIVASVIGHKSSDDRELQMIDGLLELMISYQVIHRLRDLFALYDRPQVEASPFPSTILLSIHLLVVLTSRPEASIVVDWESLALETMAEECPEAIPGDQQPHPSSVNGTTTDDAMCITKGVKNPTDGLEELNACASDDVQACSEPKNISVGQKDRNTSCCKEPVSFLLSAISETGLVCLPSLLASVLLQANNRSSPEQASDVLPSNFEEVATGVIKVLNNLALVDIRFVQKMLARPDLKMEFFHVMSFILTHCTSRWKTATDQVGLLLLESLLLLGHFSLFHLGNQAVLRWGKSPTILHKICDLPFMFFSDPDLMPLLAGALVAACYGCQQNKDVVQQELNLDMLLSLLKSCSTSALAIRSTPTVEDPTAENSSEPNPESKKSQGDIFTRSNRYGSRRLSFGKGAAYGNNTRMSRTRNQRDGRATKSSEERSFDQNLWFSEGSVMLHCRFPSSFIDKAEQFFSGGT